MPVRGPGPPIDDGHCRIGAAVCSVGWGMVEAAAKVAEIEELEQLGRTLLRGLDDRLAAHAEVHRRGRRGPPWTCSAQHEETFFAEVRGGELCKASAGTAWSLLMYWHDGDSTRVLARGKRRDVDRYAEEVLHYGPPGGPEYTGGDLAWSSWAEEPTLQAATIGGQLRLAPMTDGPHLLMVARNDHRVDVLALGDREGLQATAEEHLHEWRGDSLHLWVGDERVYLQALGFASIVGYVELQRGARLVLGHLEADCFGLFHEAGKAVTCRGIYTLADLRRGELGRMLVWSTSPDCGVASASPSQVEVTAPLASSPSEDTGSSSSSSPPEGAQPSSSSSSSWPPPPSSPEGAKPSSAPPNRPRRTVTRRMVSLSSEDVEMVQAHLRCKVEPSGEGCTVKPDVFKGLRGLVALGVGDLLLYAGDYKKLFAERVEVFIHCDAKTITRAFRSIARDTDLVVRVGRRWLFRGGDLQLEGSELLRAIREATAGVQGDDARSSVETDWSTPTPRVAHAAPTVVATREASKDSNLGSDDGTSIEHDPAPRRTTPPLHADEDRARPGAAVPQGAPLETGPVDEPEAASQVPDPTPTSPRSGIQWKYLTPIPPGQAASQFQGRTKERKARRRGPSDH
jgi:hypothetical protein